MKRLQNFMLWMLLLIGLSTQVQAQCTLTADISADSSVCPVVNIYARVQYGTAPYSYNWSNGVTTSYNSNLLPGVFYLTVTDNLGCTAVDSFSIQNMPPVQIIPSITPASCGQNGAIDLTILGGSGVFQINWLDLNTFQTVGYTEDLLNVAASSYMFFLQDPISGCSFQQGPIVVNSTGGTLTVNTTNSTCNQQNGAVTAVVTGFSNPTFLWSTGATTATVSALLAGTYTVTVSDASCTITETAVVQNFSPLTVYLNPYGGCPADSLRAYVSGGQMPYTFVWSTGTSTTLMNFIDFENVSGPGLYSVTIIDANGCAVSDSYTVVTTNMVATYAVQDASCAGNDGAININVSGGIGNYSYYWSNGENTEDLSGLTPGVYDVTIYDGTQCYVYIYSIVVSGGGNAFVNGYAMPANCSNSGGSINQTITGLINPTYIWNTGATTASLSNLASGWYGVTISDNIGCYLVRNYYVDYDTACEVHITGYVYNVSLSNTCSPSGASPVAYAIVILQPTGEIGFTDANGFYDFSPNAPGNYSVEFVTNSSSYTVLCPTGNSIAVNGTVFGGNYGGNNFYIVSPYSQDLSINLGHYSTVAPGFPYWTYAEFCNNGQNIISGNIDYTYDAGLVFNVISSMSSTGSSVFTGHNTSNHLLTF